MKTPAKRFQAKTRQTKSARRAPGAAMEHRAREPAMRRRQPDRSLHAVPMFTSSLRNNASSKTSFRGLPKAGTRNPEVVARFQLHRDSGFISARRPGMTDKNEAGMSETDVVIIGAGHNG